MTAPTAQTPLQRPPARPPLGSASALRQLRVAAGLTQTDLAGDRFSKEYVSQIERGKTRPTAETIAWLADRLGVDAGYLANGVSTDERGRVEADARPRRGADRGSPLRGGAQSSTRRSGRRSPRRLARARGSRALGRGLGPHAAGRASGPRSSFSARARTLTEGPSFSDVDRAEVLFRLGVCRYKLSSISTALALFNEALNARRALRAAVRPAPLEHPRLALAVLPAPARLRGRARGRRARARAGAVARRPPDHGATCTSRPRSSPSARATGCSPATTRSAPRRYYEESERPA